MLNKFKLMALIILFFSGIVCYASGEHPHQKEIIVQPYHEKTITKPKEKHDKEIHLSQDAIKKADIQILMTSSQEITIKKKVIGKITPNANKTIYIYPRYNGLIKALTKELGEDVQRGELLSVIESNDTLQKYSITSPFSGVIVKKLANIGEQVEVKKPIYQLSNLNTVWCDLSIYRKDAHHVKKGQKVIVKDEVLSVTSTISYVSPLGVEHNQTMLARVVLDNKNSQWLPGMYVDVFIDVENKSVPIAVAKSALHDLEGKKVIFKHTNEGFEAVSCTIGMVGQDYVEVQGCLQAGDKYAANNSYLIKAHLGKEGASHEH